ncbi:hypothetical protein HPB51_026290 [Rhipicephalus microplus]|uniref:Uncharacterized protein n=1 Tax=Rhipicephalus microplus TaxID=6941 RepID=A0A9J6D7N5_RHIMP|nr:hypothetical protein HPB51_026290 [Rhipicephalus microplus]
MPVCRTKTRRLLKTLRKSANFACTYSPAYRIRVKVYALQNGAGGSSPASQDQAPEARLFRSGKAKTRGDKRPKTTRRDTGTTRERTRAVSIYMAGRRNTRDKRGTRTAEKKATNALSGSNRGRRKRRSERSLRRRERATRRQVRGQCMQRPLRSLKTMFAAAFSCVQ